MSDIQSEKAKLRKAAHIRRNSSTSSNEFITQQANYNLLNFLKSLSEKIISGYLPIGSELSPIASMKSLSAKNTICVPVVEKSGAPLKFAQWEYGCETEKGAYGIAVPKEKRWVCPEILIAPLLAFDKSGNRMGYGGGFYDRTLQRLSKQTRILSIGIGFSFQEFDHIICEPTDIALDAIITEKEIFEF